MEPRMWSHAGGATRVEHADVPRAWYVVGMRDRYSFTGDGLHNVAVYGIDPIEVWQVLRAQRRLTRQMSEDANAVFGVTGRGRHIVVFVVESSYEDNDWDIVAARDMFPDEIAMFTKYVGGTHE